jgi:hypothetical protein
MTTTYSINEGNDALNRVLLMMRYELGKTLGENLISEQVYTKTTDGNYELKIGPFSGVDAAKIFPYLKQNEYPKKLDSYYSPIGGIPDDVLDGINKFRPSISPKPYQYTDFGYAKSNAYYPRWKKEWKQKNPGRKLGHEQQTLDKYGRASTVWVDEYGKESPVVNLANEKLISGIEKIWVNWDHDTSGYVEIALTGAGVLLALTGVGAPLGAVLIGVGTAVGIADAIKYYEENNPYMGTMMLALQLIPGGELVGILAKTSPKFTKPILKKFNVILQKLSKNKSLTDVEGKFFEWCAKQFNKHLPEISKLLRKHSFKALRLKLKREKSSIVLRTIISLLHFGLKKAPSFIGKLIIKVGRISITVDQLWMLMSTPDSWLEKMRDKGEFSQILDMLYDGTLTDSVKEGLWVVWQKILGNDVNEDINEELLKEMESQMDKYDKNFELSEIPISDNIIPNRWEKINKTNNQPIKTKSVTFNDVIKGTQTIKKGDKGNVVREIQNMLSSIGYYLGDSGKQTNGVDGDFGTSTETVVKYFQIENNLNETGVVDKITANKLKEKYDER